MKRQELQRRVRADHGCLSGPGDQQHCHSAFESTVHHGKEASEDPKIFAKSPSVDLILLVLLKELLTVLRVVPDGKVYIYSFNRTNQAGKPQLSTYRLNALI